MKLNEINQTVDTTLNKLLGSKTEGEFGVELLVKETKIPRLELVQLLKNNKRVTFISGRRGHGSRVVIPPIVTAKDEEESVHQSLGIGSQMIARFEIGGKMFETAAVLKELVPA